MRTEKQKQESIIKTKARNEAVKKWESDNGKTMNMADYIQEFGVCCIPKGSLHN